MAALVKAKIPHTLAGYDHDPRAASFGLEAAQALGIAPDRVFKTLVASLDGRLVVAIVPVSAHLDLKALAAALGGKKAAMADVADAERSSGYVTGGISPIGQRKALPTALDTSAAAHPSIYVSAGRRGLEICLSPDDLLRITRGVLAPIAAGRQLPSGNAS